MLMRTVVEEEIVKSILDKNKKKYPRIDEVFDALKWRLSRSPDSGSVFRKGLYLLASADDIKPQGIPKITLLYKFNDIEVTILAVKVE